jgi:hypothetical protein
MFLTSRQHFQAMIDLTKNTKKIQKMRHCSRIFVNPQP